MKLLRRALFLLLVCMPCINVHALSADMTTASGKTFVSGDKSNYLYGNNYEFYVYENYGDNNEDYLVFTRLGNDYTYGEVSGDADPRVWADDQYDGYNIEFIEGYSIGKIPNYAF